MCTTCQVPSLVGRNTNGRVLLPSTVSALCHILGSAPVVHRLIHQAQHGWVVVLDMPHVKRRRTTRRRIAVKRRACRSGARRSIAYKGRSRAMRLQWAGARQRDPDTGARHSHHRAGLLGVWRQHGDTHNGAPCCALFAWCPGAARRAAPCSPGAQGRHATFAALHLRGVPPPSGNDPGQRLGRT